MPLTYSIANGIALAFVTYAAVRILSGQANRTSGAIWIVAILSILSFVV
jgi:AGZA family xanthine/uracil permease-like MFS transporter